MDPTCPNVIFLGSKVAWTWSAICCGVQPHPRSSQIRCAIPIRASSWPGQGLGKVAF